MRDAIIETIRETFALGPAPLTEATPLADFMRDSIDVVELVAVLSTEYGVEVDPQELEGITTIGDVVSYASRHAGEGRGSQPLESF